MKEVGSGPLSLQISKNNTFWRRVILLTRYVFFAGVVMVAQVANILCAISSLQWAAPTVAMVVVVPISF